MNRFKIRLSTTVICAALAAGQISALPLSAVAGTTQVKIGSHVVFTNAVGDTQSIQDNLDNALAASSDRSPSAVHVVNAKTGSVITLNGYKIATVDAAKAKAAGTTPPLLAKRWSDALRKELANTTFVNQYVAQISGAVETAVADEPPAAPARQPVQNNYAAQNTTSVNPAANQPMQQASVQMNTMAANNQYQGQPQYQGQSQFQGQTGYQGQAPYQGQGQFQGRVMFAPAGLSLPVTLKTAVSTQVAKPGDLIEGAITEDVNLGNGRIPAGSSVIGTVTDAEAGRRLNRSGSLSITFNRLRLPDGTESPMNAHIVGGLGKYSLSGNADSDTVRGETTKNKVTSAAARTLIGTGSGAALGTAVGAIAGGKHGAGTGAWSGAAIGGGVGLADSLLLRKAADVVVQSGTKLQVQLDSPLQISTTGPNSY